MYIQLGRKEEKMKIGEKLRWSRPEEQAEILRIISIFDIDDIFCHKVNEDFGCKKLCHDTGKCEYTLTEYEMFLWLLRQDEIILERGFLQDEQKHRNALH